MLTSSQLKGLSKEKAMLYGLPHIGARYIKPGTSPSYERISDTCAVCGKFATSCHHIVPRSYGRVFKLETPTRGTYALRSPLFALCGSGTTGCHNDFHGGAMLKARWVWDSQSYEDAWWSGELLARYGAHSPELFNYGCWEIENKRLGITFQIRGNREVY